MSDVETRPLVGTPRQVTYAQDTLATLRRLFPGQPLPGVESAHWWIEHRDCTPAELWHLARTAPPDAFSDRWSPFMNTYPRYGRQEAITTLRLLGEYTVLDLEATSIGKVADVVQVGVVGSDLRVLMNTYVKPPDLDKFAGSKAQQVNGISVEALKGAPTLPDIWSDLLPLVTAGRLITWNADYDCRVLRQSAYRQGLVAPAIKGLCAMKLTTAYLELDFWASLGEALAALDISREDGEPEHDALGDAIATVKLLRRLQELTRSERPA